MRFFRKIIVDQNCEFVPLKFIFPGDKQKTIDRLLYGGLPSTLHGQKVLSLIGSDAVGLSPKIRENVYFRKDDAAVHIPIRVSKTKFKNYF